MVTEETEPSGGEPRDDGSCDGEPSGGDEPEQSDDEPEQPMTEEGDQGEEEEVKEEGIEIPVIWVVLDDGTEARGDKDDENNAKELEEKDAYYESNHPIKRSSMRERSALLVEKARSVHLFRKKVKRSELRRRKAGGANIKKRKVTSLVQAEVPREKTGGDEEEAKVASVDIAHDESNLESEAVEENFPKNAQASNEEPIETAEEESPMSEQSEKQDPVKKSQMIAQPKNQESIETVEGESTKSENASKQDPVEIVEQEGSPSLEEASNKDPIDTVDGEPSKIQRGSEQESGEVIEGDDSKTEHSMDQELIETADVQPDAQKRAIPVDLEWASDLASGIFSMISGTEDESTDGSVNAVTDRTPSAPPPMISSAPPPNEPAMTPTPVTLAPRKRKMQLLSHIASSTSRLIRSKIGSRPTASPQETAKEVILPTPTQTNPSTVSPIPPVMPLSKDHNEAQGMMKSNKTLQRLLGSIKKDSDNDQASSSTQSLSVDSDDLIELIDDVLIEFEDEEIEEGLRRQEAALMKNDRKVETMDVLKLCGACGCGVGLLRDDERSVMEEGPNDDDIIAFRKDPSLEEATLETEDTRSTNGDADMLTTALDLLFLEPKVLQGLMFDKCEMKNINRDDDFRMAFEELKRRAACQGIDEAHLLEKVRTEHTLNF